MFMRERKIESAIKRLESLISKEIKPITNLTYAECGYKTKNVPDDNLAFCELTSETVLHALDKHYWIKGGFKTESIPAYCEQYLKINGITDARNSSSGQCIVYLNGEMVQEFDANHTEVLLGADTEYELLVYFYGGYDNDAYKHSHFNISFDIIEKNTKIEKLYYDLCVPFESCLVLDKQSQDYADILKSLDYAVNIIDLYDDNGEEFMKSVSEALRYLENEFYGKICRDSKSKVYCVGQTHIDVAWLWTLAQTREKVQRSFSTVLALMEKYPEYIFMCSQPQLYQYIKEEAPEVYGKIKEKIKEGRWEPEGAMWLEADCNLISGESFIRQIIYGKRFFKEEFGTDSKYLWMPDVFGYSAALPQILKKCGVDYFLTTKISWNEFNKMPYDTFLWEGLDGTRVFTYFFDPINVDLTPDAVYRRYKEGNKEKMYSSNALIGFGFGDGGGGPTSKMLEIQRRTARGIPGMPQTKMSTVGEFLKTHEKAFNESCKTLNRTPAWVGDLYLEFHRGTYTSVAKVKKHNRKSELMTQKTETAAVTDYILLGGAYPKEELQKNQKLILLNQFHDIIPGSSIKEVYDDSDKQYEMIFKSAERLLNNALTNIEKNIATDGGALIYNANGFSADGIIENGEKTYFVKNIPSFGYRVTKLTETKSEITFKNFVCETPFYKVKFDENYNIISLFDKENNREAVSENGLFNELRVYKDNPYAYDAWDICEYAKDTHISIFDVRSVKTADKGESFEIEIKRNFQSSEITQTLCFYNHLRRIDVKNKIDWKEKKVFLKAFFPINVHTSEATYDVQFGNIKRNTHSNTSWDRAKFEVCAHKWADVSETGYGVSIMNDCKYGYGCELNVLSISLIKCALSPNPKADKEMHEFTYSIFPHSGNFMEANVAKEAYMLNQPLTFKEIQKQSGKLPEEFELIKTAADNVITETVKLAEEGSDIIVRLYEYFNMHSNVQLEFGFDFKEAHICDMLENNTEKLNKDGRKISFDINPFEIVTIKLTI